MRSVRKKQKNFYKFLKGLVIFSVIFIFVYIGAEPYVKAYSANLAVGVNYACDILVLANLVVIFLYYSKYGKVESFLKDIENELEDAGYYISSREKENINDRCDTICKDLENNGYKISKNFDVKDFSFNVRALKGKNYFYIITNKPYLIKDYIINNLNHTVTIVAAKGGYSDKRKKILLCVIPTTEYTRLKEIIKELDKNAFFLITDSYSMSKQ